MLDEAAVRQLKVVELKAELLQLGLSTSGRKDELVERLLEALAGRPASGAAAAAPAALGSARPSDAGLGRKDSSPAAEDSEEYKRASRAERFNLGPSETDLLQRRRERFGSVADDLLDPERLRARQARFGTTTSSVLLQEDEEVQKLKRLQRFGFASK